MSLHHTNDSICPLCEEKLKTADPRMSAWFRQVKIAFPDLHISCAYRGKKEQEEAVAGGKSRAHFPYSKHNHTDGDGNPCALALDVFQLQDGKAIFDPEFYFKLHTFNENLGFNIAWGGEFKKFKDYCHFEWV
jgi:hypothetical protein